MNTGMDHNQQYEFPVMGLCAYSGSGKTTLLEKLIPLFNARGLNVAVIKHAHHSFDIDYPEKDSYRIRKAGAQQILISSRKRWALIHENTSEKTELSLHEALMRINPEPIDFVMVEGFKAAPIPKIEIHRPALGKPLLAVDDPCVIAIATDEPMQIQITLPVLDLDDTGQIAKFIEQRLHSGNKLHYKL